MSAENIDLKKEVDLLKKQSEQEFETSEVFMNLSGCVSDLNLRL